MSSVSDLLGAGVDGMEDVGEPEPACAGESARETPSELPVREMFVPTSESMSESTSRRCRLRLVTLCAGQSASVAGAGCGAGTDVRGRPERVCLLAVLARLAKLGQLLPLRLNFCAPSVVHRGKRRDACGRVWSVVAGGSSELSAASCGLVLSLPSTMILLEVRRARRTTWPLLTCTFQTHNTIIQTVLTEKFSKCVAASVPAPCAV